MVDLDYIKKVKQEYQKATEQAKQKGFVNDELVEKQTKNKEVLAQRRGVILDEMSQVEHLLNIFLATYFTHRDYTNFEQILTSNESQVWSQFYELVLGQDFFTFHQKVKLFGKLKYHKDEKFGGVFDGLTGNLHELKDMRNIVAHGFKSHGTKPEVKFLGSHKVETIDDEFMKEFNKKFEIAFLCVTKLIDSLYEIKP
jgi:hypothetical protein